MLTGFGFRKWKVSCWDAKKGQESQPGGISQFSLEIEAKLPIFSDISRQT
jgi:hypothetical protein